MLVSYYNSLITYYIHLLQLYYISTDSDEEEVVSTAPPR